MRCQRPKGLVAAWRTREMQRLCSGLFAKSRGSVTPTHNLSARTFANRRPAIRPQTQESMASAFLWLLQT